MPIDLTELSVCRLVDAYDTGELSPVEVVNACLDRISAVEPHLNAVVTLCAQSALASARAAEARWTTHTARALEGVPFGLKDLIATAGVRTTGGSRLFEDYVPEAHAAVTERLLNAGGILVAKLQTSELAAGGANFGVIRNPWDLERIPAGSSSGSAVAVASRELPLALGTDTGGSIRIPTAFCGITSLKPTFGRISRYGVMPISWTLDHVGPMARSAEDIALSLGILAGYDRRDPTSSTQRVPDYQTAMRGNFKGMRIGIPDDWFFDLCDSQVRDAVYGATSVLESAGAVTKRVGLPILRTIDPVALGHIIIRAECASLHEVNLARLGEYSPEFAQQILEGRFVNAVDYLRALRLRHVVQLAFEDVFQEVDVLVTPGAVGVAPRFSDKLLAIDGNSYPWMDVIMRTSGPLNVVGLPALGFPVGLSRESLPMGMQVVAAPFDESSCLRVAYAYQNLTEHHLARPPVVRLGIES